MSTTHSVYWIKLESFTDIHTQGYVGVTNNTTRRFKEHLYNKGKLNTHLQKAIHKYGKESISFEVIHTNLTKEEAYELEYYYRPEKQLGWNEIVGGSDTFIDSICTPIAIYHKDFYTILYKFKSIEDAANFTGSTASRFRQALYRKSNNYGLDGWAILHNTEHDRSTTITINELRSKTLKGLRKSVSNVFKGVTDRWSKEDKERISKQHKGKTISEEQKETVRLKNRTNSPLCRPITLVHKDAKEIEHSFHSISEASRQLNIPLSRLKSKATRPLNVYGLDGWKITYLGSE